MGMCEKFGKQGLTFDDVLLIPGMIERIGKYVGRNGIGGTILKIIERLNR